MRRPRPAVLMPAFVVVGGVIGSPAAAVAGSTVPTVGAVSWCVINPITDSGCLPVPCPAQADPLPAAGQRAGDRPEGLSRAAPAVGA